MILCKKIFAWNIWYILRLEQNLLFFLWIFCCCFLFRPIIQLYLLQVKTWSALSEEKKPPSTHKETRRKNKNAPLLISSVLFNLSRKESWSANHMYRNFGEVFRQMELVFFFCTENRNGIQFKFFAFSQEEAWPRHWKSNRMVQKISVV